METRNLHSAASVQRVAFDNTPQRFGHDGCPTEWRVPTNSGRLHLHSENQHQSLRRLPGRAAVSQDMRDDVLLPPAIRSATVLRGLAEVTNCLEYENRFGRWRHARKGSAYAPKHLPASAYTERFRSLSNAQGSEPSCPSSVIAYRGSSYWRDREAFVQLQASTNQSMMHNSYETSSKPCHLPLHPPVPFRPLRSLPANTGFNSSRPFASFTYALCSESSTVTNNSRPSDDLGAHVAASPVRKREYATEKSDFKCRSHAPDEKRLKVGMLDILCSATLELGPIQANPVTGCSCPRSNCIKLYCDCFKSGRPCSGICSCLNCKNTEEETKIDGERIRAIKNTLARNPRAFTGGKKEAVPQNPGDIVCNCLKSRCLKLYCHCFHKGRTCNEACLCISCLNTPVENVVGGKRNLAIQNCLEKRPDAFTKKPKAVGAGCACKNNKCLKKYCDCFRFNLACLDKCICKDCGNGKVVEI